jgi:hypothetical protein
LTVIKRRSVENRQREKDRGWFFDLKGVYLPAPADLGGAHLEGADFIRVHLEGAFLMGVHFDGASLIDAHLEGAWLLAAHLEGADLRDASSAENQPDSGPSVSKHVIAPATLDGDPGVRHGSYIFVRQRGAVVRDQ